MSGFLFGDTNKIWASKTGLNYSRVFFFEQKYFDESYIDQGHEWIYHNWKLSILYAGIYIAAIFTGQAYMKTREKFDFRRGLIAWNLVLSGFSALGAIRLWPEFVYTVRTHGVEHSVCNQDYAHGISGCWTWMFILSKLPELVDTFFIVVRKQKLIFLHWYHHATVLIYCWYSTHDFSATGRWFVLMNYTIHAIMYGYYAFRALRFTIPKWIMITITTGQISQMVVGIYVNLVAYYRKNRGEECHVTYDNIKWSFIMYFTYFLLFVYFFYSAYMAKPKKGSVDKKKTQ